MGTLLEKPVYLVLEKLALLPSSAPPLSFFLGSTSFCCGFASSFSFFSFFFFFLFKPLGVTGSVVFSKSPEAGKCSGSGGNSFPIARRL